MLPLAERWASGGWRGRGMSWLVFTLLCAGVSGGVHHRTGVTRQQQLADEQQEHQLFRVQQRRLLGMTVTEALPVLAPRSPLPVLAFAASSGGQFVAWHPEKPAGSELSFTLPWEKVPPLFPPLMGYAIALRGFSLAPHASGLLLTLELDQRPE